MLVSRMNARKVNSVAEDRPKTLLCSVETQTLVPPQALGLDLPYVQPEG